MNKRISIISIVLLFFVVGIFLWQSSGKNNVAVVDKNGGVTKIKMVTTFYPLQFFAEQVGGKNVEIVTLTPAGGEPHDYEPTPQDVIKITTADVFIMNGANFEPWAEKLLPQLNNEKVRVVKMSEYVDVLTETGVVNPHFWLDPIEAQAQVEAIQEVLIALDEKNAGIYTENAERLLFQLSVLDQNFKDGLADCVQKEIVTSHNAFGYVAERYNFFVHSIAGFSPTQEPSAKHLVELSKLVKEKQVQYIFTETLASPKFSETLAQEAKVKTLVLNPLEGLTEEELKQGKNYITVMRENLQNLRLSLECK